MRPAERDKRLAAYLKNGAKYEQWQSDPFLALTFFWQLRRGFGWEPFLKVFAEYEKLPQNERPRTDTDKHDQFMTRFSKAVGKNLSGFFQAWGIPTTPEARRALSELPRWMPDDWKKE
jgi:hypothetical protein